jgi:2-polyprenyl-3-methyl-5-hydroxy-6-metoxy-1,4-benzoquinol methylase
MKQIKPDKRKTPRIPSPTRDQIDDIVNLRKKMGNRFPKFAVFIVAYNAATTLRETLERIHPEIYNMLECVFLIDDFSEDETYRIGVELAKDRQWKKLRVFRNPRNYGYGGNQKIGYRYAIEGGFDYVILLHGDGQYAPEFMPNLIWPVLFMNKEVVFGSRMINRRDALKGKMPFYKFAGNIILTTFENILLDTHMSEFHSGYRLYGTRVLRRIPFELNTDDFHFDTQIIIQCFALGVSIHEVAIPTYYGKEISYVNGLKYAKDVVRDVIEYRLHQLHVLRRSRYITEENVGYTLKRSPYGSHRQIASMIQRGSFVLDVGCASGFLANALIHKEVALWGIDIAPNKKIEGVSRYICHDLEKIAKLDLGEKFDYIVIADVVEHLRNAGEVLRRLSKNLKSNGKVIVSTGNIAIWFYRLSLLLGRFKYGPRGILDETHVKLYTLDTFLDLISDAGYKALSIKYTPIPFELVFSSRGKSNIPSMIERTYYLLTRLWPRMFAYQFIVEAEISAVDFGQGEGEIGSAY